MLLKEIRHFWSPNHQEVNLKVQLLIKSGHYIVPDPSTPLQFIIDW